MTDLLNWLIGPGLATCRRGGADGMRKAACKYKIVAAVAVLLLLPFSGFAGADSDDDLVAQAGNPPAGIIDKYLQATQTHEDTLRGASMEVDISAEVPKLKEHGRLRALRKISKVGQVTYHVLGFQGSNTVKNQVIARYLQAEQQGQGDQSLAITPVNYKFKYKGNKDEHGQEVYVFQLSPRKKKVGLFKGEMWLDTRTDQPVFEKGRFVKNPSIFFKKVEFLRFFDIKNGAAVPLYMTSTIDVRFIGKVEISINYSNFSQSSNTAEAEGNPEPLVPPNPNLLAK